MKETYMHTLINWNWYLEVEIHEDDTCTIHKHHRLHYFRDAAKHPKTVGAFQLIENKERTVTDAVLSKKSNRSDAKTYKVRNQQNVFSYE